MQVIEPLFTYNSLKNQSDKEIVYISFLYRFEPDNADESVNQDESVLKPSEDPVDDDMLVMSQVDLPFGIGDRIFLRESFRVNSYNEETQSVVFEYHDGKTKTARIHESYVFSNLIQKDNNGDFPWRIPGEIPQEGVRTVWVVQSADPVKLKNMTDDVAQKLGCKDTADLFRQVKNADEKADSNSWLIILKLNKEHQCNVNMWSNNEEEQNV